MEVEVSGKQSEIFGLSEIPCLSVSWAMILFPHFIVECSHSKWIMVLMGYL